MPRQARQLSETGYLHLILRGIGRQAIFEEREDYLRFLSVLARFCGETEIKVLAWCLMENHVHLLVRDGEGRTPLLMKKLGVSYSHYFNRKYDRCGHLFQDRYLSEVVEDEAYLLTALRYILNNPRKAGICEARDYEWSSYGQYDNPPSFMELSLVRELIGDGERFLQFVAEVNDDVCLEYDGPKRDDEWARKVIRECLHEENGMALQALDRQTRNTALRQLKEQGLTVRQIERLTGINRGVVQKA
jgi:REP element-mobilizing transposase RayT